MSDSVYKVIEIIGTSKDSWENAAKIAVERASKTLRDLRVAEVVSQDLVIEDGKVAAYPDEAECILQVYGLKSPVGPSVGDRQIKARAVRS